MLQKVPTAIVVSIYKSSILYLMFLDFNFLLRCLLLSQNSIAFRMGSDWDITISSLYPRMLLLRVEFRLSSFASQYIISYGFFIAILRLYFIPVIYYCSSLLAQEFFFHCFYYCFSVRSYMSVCSFSV